MELPKGFLFSGMSCGIKNNGELDIGIIYSSIPCNYAAAFTTNSIKAAPVIVCKDRMGKSISGVIANSGNANALTGKNGLSDTLKITELAEKNLNTKDASFLSLSTGIIGRDLPMNKIEDGIVSLCKEARLKKSDHIAFARAILTTDTKVKIISKVIYIDQKKVSLLGIAKGSGMIHPNMATMLAFITSDIAISKDLLQDTLKSIIPNTFNAISVDGDQSTNDSVVLLSNGLASNKEIIEKEDSNLVIFKEALEELCLGLAIKIVEDGEGATKFIHIDILGAKTKEDAKSCANAIAISPLVKTAFFGADPNWGRFISAMGTSGAIVDEEKLDLTLGSFMLFSKGRPTDYEEDTIREYMQKNSNIYLCINLNLGEHKETIYTCDLTDKYIQINSEYST